MFTAKAQRKEYENDEMQPASFPRMRESSLLSILDARFRGHDETYSLLFFASSAPLQ